MKLLEKGTKVAFIVSIKNSVHSLTLQYNGLCFHKDVDSFMMGMKRLFLKRFLLRLFVESSKASLKAAHLHNDNTHPSIPVAHSVQLKGAYETITLSLNAPQYPNFSSKFCGTIQ